MKGERVHPNKFGALRLAPGAYGQELRGGWRVRPPGQNAVAVPEGAVEEHDDGTITTTCPVRGPDGRAFYIVRGTWQTA